MRKLSHKTIVSTIRDIITEGEANAGSGDTRVAGDGRRIAIIGQVLLQILSSIPEKDFNDIKVVNYNKNDLKDVEDAETLVGLDTDDVKA